MGVSMGAREKKGCVNSENESCGMSRRKSERNLIRDGDMEYSSDGQCPVTRTSWVWQMEMLYALEQS